MELSGEPRRSGALLLLRADDAELVACGIQQNPGRPPTGLGAFDEGGPGAQHVGNQSLGVLNEQVEVGPGLRCLGFGYLLERDVRRSFDTLGSLDPHVRSVLSAGPSAVSEELLPEPCHLIRIRAVNGQSDA